MSWRSVLFLFLIMGCREADAPVDAAAAPGDAGVDAAPQADAATQEPDAAPDAAPASECPPPAVLAPEDVPEGYLPPVVTRYLWTVDGDTAHLQFQSGDETLRFLFINTEESHGDETTQFGVETGEIVEHYMETADEIVAVVRENEDEPGRPDLDPYDRWLSLIFLDGELLQTRIVREGLSAYYTPFGCAPEPIHSSLVYAEAEAKAFGRGIWQAGHPTDYEQVLSDWIRWDHCRPNPYEGPYCE